MSEEMQIEVVNGALVPNAAMVKAIRDLAQFQVKAQAMKNEEELLKRAIDKAYKDAGIEPRTTTFAGANFIYRKPSTRTTIDSKRLKAELPDIAKEYSKETTTSGSWSVNYSPVGD